MQVSTGIAGGVIVVTMLSIAACSDSMSTDARIAGSPDGAAIHAPDIAASAVRARNALHRRNSEDWVGIAHNKMLDDFRREMRKPGKLASNICTFVMDFAMRDERLPPGRQFSAGVHWRAASSAADSSTLCQNHGRGKLSTIAFRAPFEPFGARPQESGETGMLLADIETAVGSAQDSYDLATRLNGVMDRVGSLPVLDQAIVSSTVSVAQNSFEYWERQYPLFEQEVVDEYGPCVGEQSAIGADGERALEECLKGGGGSAVTLRGKRTDGKPQRLVKSGAPVMCGGVTLSEGWRHVVGADAKGAFTGGFAGGLAGGFGGAVLGAIVGGGAASTWAALENAWSKLKCVYHF